MRPFTFVMVSNAPPYPPRSNRLKSQKSAHDNNFYYVKLNLNNKGSKIAPFIIKIIVTRLIFFPAHPHEGSLRRSYRWGRSENSVGLP